MAQPTCCSRTVFFGRQPKAGLATGTTWSRYPDSDLLVAPGGLLFPNQTVGIQYMLNYHLKLDLEPDGNYDATVAAGTSCFLSKLLRPFKRAKVSLKQAWLIHPLGPFS